MPMLRRCPELNLHVTWVASASSRLWRVLAPGDDAVQHIGVAGCVYDAAVGHGDAVRRSSSW